ncbi:MAG: prepilin-type N-terminal cleavage/methylation domain-containing protein [Succinivibrionaceae bacterium]|nr:prepilin-type N-terminal cleavage/methylation domain-containing protein [Succinivibrionaceae bacterium]
MKSERGFTLVELVIGMVLLGIACAGSLSLLLSQKSAYRDPMVQQTSLQIINKIAGEIRIRSFDSKSDLGGGVFRCSEPVIDDFQLAECTTEAKYGIDAGESASDIGTFDDIDDFVTAKLCASIAGCQGEYAPAAYFYSIFKDDSLFINLLDGYFVRVRVTPCRLSALPSGGDANITCSGADDHSAKKIDISILQRDDNVVDYSFLKANI